MSWSYDKLLTLLLVKKKMKKTDLITKVGINATAWSHIFKGENVSLTALDKICDYFDCDIGDIMEHVKDPKGEDNSSDDE